VLEHEVLDDDLRAVGGSELEERVGQTNLLDAALSNELYLRDEEPQFRTRIFIRFLGL